MRLRHSATGWKVRGGVGRRPAEEEGVTEVSVGERGADGRGTSWGGVSLSEGEREGWFQTRRRRSLSMLRRRPQMRLRVEIRWGWVERTWRMS